MENSFIKICANLEYNEQIPEISQQQYEELSIQDLLNANAKSMFLIKKNNFVIPAKSETKYNPKNSVSLK